MKPSKAPEKIYIHRTVYLAFWAASEINITGNDVEYIRADAFIEKACEWLRENKDKYLYNTGEKGEYIPVCSGNMVDDFRKYMEGNLETKEVQEEPASKGLEEAAIDYCSGNKGADARVRAGFIEGAEWKEDQFKKNLLDACKKQTEEEAEIERDFIEGFIENKCRLPTFDDAIKYGMRLQKEQMMKDAIDAVVSQVPCSNEIILYNPSSVYKYSLPQEMNELGLNKGDKVKVIVITED